MRAWRRWLARYGWAELIGLFTALASVALVTWVEDGYLAAAFVAPWGENVGFYGTMVFRELRSEINAGSPSTYSAAASTARHMIFEFGPAELVDSLLVRPLLIYLGQVAIGNVAVGVILGKLAADVVFYIPVVISYELRIRLTHEDSERDVA